MFRWIGKFLLYAKANRSGSTGDGKWHKALVNPVMGYRVGNPNGAEGQSQTGDPSIPIQIPPTPQGNPHKKEESRLKRGGARWRGGESRSGGRVGFDPSVCTGVEVNQISRNSIRVYISVSKWYNLWADSTSAFFCMREAPF